ncbi:MAG: Uma2 family endonuclease [Rhodospirillaceae bacterium]|nr:Uma2 family endonuclease [Rhodospirillaceae bacterium]
MSGEFCDGPTPGRPQTTSTPRDFDRHGKRPVYAREGVRHLWFVDPAARDLEAFELRDGEWVLIATARNDDPVSIPPFDAVTFPLDALWP